MYTDTKTHPARAAQAAAMVHLVEIAARTPLKSQNAPKRAKRI